MKSTREQSEDRGTRLKVMLVWVVIMLLGSFWLTVRDTSDPVSLSVMPQVPREGEPIIATFKLNNPSLDNQVVRYSFYANGQLLMEGATSIASASGKTYKYAYENAVPLGGQVHFGVKAEFKGEEYDKFLSSPPYPPQVWSSFVSFASFSTSVMSFMSNMTYYESTFGSEIGFNVGVLVTAVLGGLLIFLELTRPILQGKTIVILSRIKLRFSTVTWILFLIFLGILYTKIVMVVAT